MILVNHSSTFRSWDICKDETNNTIWFPISGKVPLYSATKILCLHPSITILCATASTAVCPCHSPCFKMQQIAFVLWSTSIIIIIMLPSQATRPGVSRVTSTCGPIHHNIIIFTSDQWTLTINVIQSFIVIPFHWEDDLYLWDFYKCKNL